MAKKNRVKHVKPGDKIKKNIIDKHEGDGSARTYTQIWTVKKVYPYHVLAERGRIRECFCYGELVQMGLERG